MGYSNRIKNKQTFFRYRHKKEVRLTFNRLLRLLNVEDDNLFTVVLIKLDRLLQPILPKNVGSFHQVYTYEEIKIRIKVTLQRALSQLYYNKMDNDNNDYLLLAFQSFKELKAYINNGHKHYGILTKIR